MMYYNKMVAVIKVNGKILREHGDEVYLPFKSEYSIMLKNLESRRALVNITIDGQNIFGNSGLVINGNSEKEITRFIKNDNLNNGPRFKFIEKTQKISEYRGDKIDDGIIRIEYQYESFQPVSTTYSHAFDYTLYNGYNIYYRTDYNNQSISCNNFYTNTRSCDGITAAGSNSTQKFTRTNIGNLDIEKYVMCIKLKGIDNNPITTKEKIECSICGIKNNSKNKFCGNCGNNLTY